MPIAYRRPDPADTAAARIRLTRLAAYTAGRGEVPTLPVSPDHEVVPAELIATQPDDLVPARATERSPAHPIVPPAFIPDTTGATERGVAEPAVPLSRIPDALPEPDHGPEDPTAAPIAPNRATAAPPAESILPGADSVDVPPPGTPLPEPAGRWSTWWSRHMPSSLRDARLDPGGRGIAAVAAVAVLAAVLAAIGVWRSRPQPIEVGAPPVTAPTPAVSATSTATVVVAVAGGVRRPGLFTLPAGSRVADVIAAAGGVRPGVSIGLLNLARRLVDGEQVIVGAAAGPQPNTPAGPAGPGSPLNLNSATLEQLDGLPGVGPVLAQRILDYRAQHGNFRSVEQLREVGGIGEAKFADLRGLVVV